MTDFYVIGVDANCRYTISGLLRTPTWHQYWGVAWVERGLWVGIRQGGPSLRRRWFVSSLVLLNAWAPASRNIDGHDAEHLSRSPVNMLLESKPDLIKDWVNRFIRASSPDREGVDGVPMTLHKIADPDARQVAINSYLSNRL